MFRPFGLLSRLRSSTFRYASESTPSFFTLPQQDNSNNASSQMLEFWLSEMRRGVDAFLDDKVDMALEIFKKHASESPYHALGYAMLAYVDFMLSYEAEKLQDASDRIADAETLARRFAQQTHKRELHSKTEKSTSPTNWRKHTCTDGGCAELSTGLSVSFTSGITIGAKKKGEMNTDLQYDLLVANCMLMSATMQILGDGWMGYVKAAYKLRKAYKMISNVFEIVTGHTPDEYVSDSARLKRTSNDIAQSALGDKTFIEEKPDLSTTNRTIESGVFFAVGLLNLIFSLLPQKVSNMLNTFGFHSSRSVAVLLLQKSYYSRGLYSPFSALTLLAHYSNQSLFVHPRLSLCSLHSDTMWSILTKMKTEYPQGKIWKLIEGKLLKLQGRTKCGVAILNEACKKKKDDMTSEKDNDSAGKIGKRYGHAQSFGNYDTSICQLPQFQALAMYEIGWGQIIMEDYNQATETFFRLESTSSCSRIFHHYIAACCIFANNQYDKAALEFLQLPLLLSQKKNAGRSLLSNEIFVEQRLRRWKMRKSTMNGEQLKRMLPMNPLWELMYLWNGFCQLSSHVLENMKKTLEEKLQLASIQMPMNLALAYLLLGSVIRELGDFQLGEMYLRKSIQCTEEIYDSWVGPYAMYEIAVISCFRHTRASNIKDARRYANEAKDWIRRIEHFLINQCSMSLGTAVDSAEPVDCGWNIKLQIRCRFLLEKLEDT